MKRIFAFVLIATFSIATCSVVDAEEGGAGLYIPGAFASAVDITPNLPGFAVATDFVFYHGSFSASRTLPVAGRTRRGTRCECAGAALSGLAAGVILALGAHHCRDLTRDDGEQWSLSRIFSRAKTGLLRECNTFNDSTKVPYSA